MNSGVWKKGKEGKRGQSGCPLFPLSSFIARHSRIIGAREKVIQHHLLGVGSGSEEPVEMHVNVAASQLGNGFGQLPGLLGAFQLGADGFQPSSEERQRRVSEGREFTVMAGVEQRFQAMPLTTKLLRKPLFVAFICRKVLFLCLSEMVDEPAPGAHVKPQAGQESINTQKGQMPAKAGAELVGDCRKKRKH